MESARVNNSFFWLFCVMGLGLVLRLFPICDIPLPFKNVLHAHSHVAFLGWIFTALFTLITRSFFTDDTVTRKKFRYQFIVSQVAVGGMLLSFLYQGYGGISIFFSSLHMFASVWFAITVFRFYRCGVNGVMPVSVKFLFGGLSLMLLSSFGPLSLPVIAKISGAGSALYSNAIYFYLHFQYNGWFIFALLALFFKVMEDNNVHYPLQAGNLLFRSLFVSVILTYFLSVLWSDPAQMIWILAGTGATIQLLSLYPLFVILTKTNFKISNAFKFLIGLVVAAFTLKVAFQFISCFPSISFVASSIRHFVVAFLHLVVLGVVTGSILIFFIGLGFIHSDHRSTRAGMILFYAGFCLTEVLALAEGLANYRSASISNYYFLQLIFSGLIFLGITLVFAGRRKPIRLQIHRLNFNSINITNNPKFQP